MSGTVIDSLVVELGLDPKNFTKGQKDALDAFKKTQAEFNKGLKDLDEGGKRAGYTFEGVTNAATGLFSVLAGASMARFARDTMNSVAATGRMAINIGAATDELSAFGRVIERNGGNAEAAMSTMKGFTDQVARLNNFGEGSQDLFRFLGTIGAPQGANALQVYEKFVEWADKNRSNPQLVNILGQSVGLDQGSINQALKGLRQYREDLRKVREGAITPEQAAAMQRMQAAWGGLDQAITMVGRDIVTDVEPAFTKIAGAASGWIERNRKLADSLGGILTAVAALSVLKPAAWVLRMLGLEGLAAVATGTAGAAFPLAVVGATGVWAANEAKNAGPRGIWGSLNGSATTDFAGRTIRPSSPGQSGGGSGQPGATGSFQSQAEKEAYIRQVASQIGISPDIAMRVARSEGFNSFVSSIPGEKSYGAFQLHVTPGGRGRAVGDQFRKDTGLDPSDPANEHQGITYALQWARKHGWGDFHGAANTGIGRWDGIGGGGGSKTDVQIGSITVTTQATDANGVAQGINSALKDRLSSASSFAAQANTGMTP